MTTYAKTWLICAALTASAAASLGACGGGGNDDDGSGGSGGAGGGAGVDCSSYKDGTPLGTLEIRVKNNRATPVYISDGECMSRFAIKAPDLMNTVADLTTVSLTCEHSQKITNFPLDCDGGTGIEIAPGGTYKLTWGGLLYQGTTMAESCYLPNTLGKPTQCLQGVAPKMGALEASVTLFQSMQCDSGFCAPVDPTEITKGFDYPAESAIQIDVNP